MAQETAPKKLFRIGEVSRLTGINPHILRYWESEFQILAPNRRLSKQRLYRQADIDLILTIKRLLEEEKYTLSGVRRFLAERQGQPRQADAPAGPEDNRDTMIQLIRKELLALREMLADSPPSLTPSPQSKREK